MATKISVSQLKFAGVDYWDRMVFAYSGSTDGKKRYLCTVDKLYNNETEEQIMADLKAAVGEVGYLYTKCPQRDFEGEPDFAIELAE